MSILQAIILGLVQGLAEFLPISSSGHLVLMQNFLGLSSGEEHIVFDILLHVGTLISIFVFYWKDIWQMICGFFGMIGDLFKGEFTLDKTNARRFICLLVIATIPLIVALIFKDIIESAFSSVRFVSIALLVTGFIMYFTDKIVSGNTTEGNTTYKNAFIVGLFQLFAILPGISRSGSTIFGGVFVGMKKEFAVKFSLLLSVIAVLGATASSIPNILDGQGFDVPIGTCLLGMAVSAISGIFAIKFLVKMLCNSKFKYFAFYCWTVGVLSLVLTFI